MHRNNGRMNDVKRRQSDRLMYKNRLLRPTSHASTMSLTLVAANLATLALGSLFFGMYSVLLILSIYLLLQRYNINATYASHNSRSKDGSSIFRSMVFLSAILLYIVVTAVSGSMFV